MADEEAEEVEVKGPKQDEDQKRGLNKVTAMGDQEKEVDTSKVAQTSLAKLFEVDKVKEEEKAKRERELAAVKINPDDVEVLVAELEIDKVAAERKLRENKGDVLETLRQALKQ
jgi:NACalpha-BTF3-like transcription factor